MRTTEPLLHEIGSLLARERRRRNWTLAEVGARGGLNYSTVREHERGRIKTLQRLARHLDAFGWGLSAVVQRALDASTGGGPAFNPALLAIHEVYPELTPEGQAMLLSLARVLPRRVVTPEPGRPGVVPAGARRGRRQTADRKRA